MPNDEIRMTKEARNPNDESCLPPPARRGVRFMRVIVVLALAAGRADAKVTVTGTKVMAETATTVAVFDGPALVSLKPVGEDIEFIHATLPPLPLDTTYVNGEGYGHDKHETTTAKALSDRAALVVVKGDDTERHLLITTEAGTNDVCVTPSGMSNRRGLCSIRWTIGLHPETSLVMPVVNGLRVDVGRPFPAGGRFAWPYEWNVQLVVVERAAASLMVHCEDTTLHYKALNLHREADRRELGFETENPGPVWDQRTAGGITWRLNTYRGGWKVPAGRYRDWMARTYDLPAKRASRPAWVDRVTLAQCWAAPNTEMLDALAAAHPPDQTIIHLAGWRTDQYDVNYPEYTPTPDTIKYMKKARQMGFHVMPHFNYFSVWLKHPFFQEVRDFQLRNLRTNNPEGWYWPPQTYDYTRMAYIHPGLSLWRHKLIDVLLGACGPLQTDFAFIDQTLCTWNTDNGLVEGLNTVAGMKQLHDEFAMVRPDFVLCGEGCNEISFQRQGFAQAHVHGGWTKIDRHQVDAYVPICSFLWAGHTKLIGYHKLEPGNPEFDAAATVYERMGALPTIITNNPKDVRDMSPQIKRIFDRAKGRPAPATTGPATSAS